MLRSDAWRLAGFTHDCSVVTPLSDIQFLSALFTAGGQITFAGRTCNSELDGISTATSDVLGMLLS